jgi:hypothetical protein
MRISLEILRAFFMNIRPFLNFSVNFIGLSWQLLGRQNPESDDNYSFTILDASKMLQHHTCMYATQRMLFSCQGVLLDTERPASFH